MTECDGCGLTVGEDAEVSTKHHFGSFVTVVRCTNYSHMSEQKWLQLSEYVGPEARREESKHLCPTCARSALTAAAARTSRRYSSQFPEGY